MDSRSDVAIAIKAKHVEEFESKFSRILVEVAARYTHADGALYYFNGVTWGEGSDDLYEWLCGSVSVEDFLVLVVFFDCPGYTSADIGKWFDNPWNIYKKVSVEIAGIPRHDDKVKEVDKGVIQLEKSNTLKFTYKFSIEGDNYSADFEIIPFVPGNYSGPPDFCYPDEGGYAQLASQIEGPPGWNPDDEELDKLEIEAYEAWERSDK